MKQNTKKSQYELTIKMLKKGKELGGFTYSHRDELYDRWEI